MALFGLLLFMQNLFLLHQQLGIVLVARIRLLRILEALIQLRRRRHRRRFPQYWIFPRPAESWFQIHLQQRHIPEKYANGQRVIRRCTKADVQIRLAQIEW